MFEALGQVSDRELMLVNLDLLDAWDAKTFPPTKLNFILYNPTAEVRTATLVSQRQKGSQFTSLATARRKKISCRFLRKAPCACSWRPRNSWESVKIEHSWRWL